MHYLKSLYNPWAVPAGVCIPCDLFPMPSQKVMVKKRFTVTLSSNGCGWVMMSPSIASDQATATYVTAGSTGGVTSAFNAGGSWTVAEAYFTDLPYTLADIETNKQIQGRVVAFGARARYIGVEDKRGGAYISLEEQDHQDLYADANSNTIDKVKSFANAYVTAPRGDGNWDVAVCYSGPTNPHEIDFVTTTYPVTPAVGADASPLVLCFAGSSDMAGQIVDIELAMHVEYIGKKVPGKTVSHADSRTYGKVLETTKEQAASSTLRPELAESGFASFVRKVIDIAPKVLSVGMGLASSIASGNPMPLIAAGAGAMGPLMLKN